MLDPVTGLDPPDVKIRATEGINAATSFIQGYWIWCVIFPCNGPERNYLVTLMSGPK